MIRLDNGIISAQINELGAELSSLTADGTEYMWSGDPTVWANQAPLLFPICGGLKDNKYTLDGREYTLAKHGYAKLSTFEAEHVTELGAVFLLRSDEKSRKSFPFDYELRVFYTLRGRSLDIEYELQNKSDKDMFFSIGAHEGYSCPEGIEQYDIIFPQKETLNAYVLDGNLLLNSTVPIIADSDTIALKQSYFAVDALVFKDMKSRRATLKNRVNGRQLSVDFDGFDYFLLWTKPNAPYICIEPWCGVQDIAGSDYDLTKKEGIRRAAPGTIFSRTHTITL